MSSKKKAKISRRHWRRQEGICEGLESRRLFAATVVANIPEVLAHPSSASTDSVNLSQFIGDPNINGTVVTFNTTAGAISVALTDNATPITVQNFLSYVNSGAYDSTFFHRNFVFSTDSGGSPTTPADIVQGGGFSVQNGSVTPVTTQAAIPDEYTSELFGDVAGTIAMAKTSEANTATSEFFFNAHDNSSVLDTPTTDDNGVQTSYTVFGVVLGNGENVINALAALQTVDLSSVNGNLATLPVTGDTSNGVAPDNLEYVNTAKVVPAFSYTVTSDNPTLVQPTISGNTLSFTYGAGATGVAEITLVANDADGTSITQSFAITVPDASKPAQGPTANADTAPDLLHDTTGEFHPLDNDTDSLSPLLPSSLTITTQAAHGVATVDPSTGNVTYVPAAGYIGADTFQYTVRDVSGQTSAPATVTINVTPDPLQITIGGATGKNLVYTQPDGTVATLTVGGGQAVVTFFSYNVLTSNSGGSIVASGPGATITNVSVFNTAKQLATLSLVAKSGAPTLGGITDLTGFFSSISIPTGTLTGNTSIGGVLKFTLGTASDADIQIGEKTGGLGSYCKLMTIGTATNTSITEPNGSGIIALKCTKWLDPDGGHSISTPFIGSLTAAQFDEGMTQTNPNPVGFVAKVTEIGSEAWSIDGYVRSITAKSVDSGWNLATNNLVVSLSLGGDFTGDISAGAIRNLTIGGALTNAVIEADAGWAAGVLRLSSVKIHGAITNSEIVSAGDIGTVSATGMSGGSILAGLGTSIVQSTGLPTSANDFTALGATIRSVQLGAKGTFVDSRIAAGNTGIFENRERHHYYHQRGDIRNCGRHDEIDFVFAGWENEDSVGTAQLANSFALKSYFSEQKITGFNNFAIEFLT